MGRSLQEQLLETGLVTEEQLERSKRGPDPRTRRDGDGKARRRAGKRRPRRRDHGPGPARAVPAPAAARSDDTRRAEIRAQIRALVLGNQRNDPKGEIAHHFVRGGRVKRVWVTPAQHAELVAGTLAVTTTRGRHWIVPAEIAARILALDPEHFVHRAAPDSEAAGDAGDEYAGYEVPDDLMW